MVCTVEGESNESMHGMFCMSCKEEGMIGGSETKHLEMV